MEEAARSGLGRDFRLFFGGQLTSQLGNSVTQLLFPVVVFHLTGSALNLGITSAALFAPYLLFGLVIGAYVDRLSRRRLMLLTDVARALIVASIPALSAAGHLTVWWVYVTAFLTSTLGIAFDTAEVAAIPAMVPSADLVEANGRVQAAYSATGVIGPLLGGALLAVFAATTILTADAVSFVISAFTLLLIRRSFDPDEKRSPSRVRDDIAEGFRFVLHNPVLRSISAMMAILNVLTSSSYAQLVLYADHRLGAGGPELGGLYAAGSFGVVVFGVLAGRLRRRFSFSQAILGAMILESVTLVAMGFVRSYPLAVVLWSLAQGLGIFFNINTRSLRQLITPPELLGRIFSIASVLAWSAIPLGTLAGGALVSGGLPVEWLFVGMGAGQALVASLFTLSPLGHADRYVQTRRREEFEPAV